ncbi:MAG: NAD(P)-dependent oxidoreductase, partial [Planctomycetes bacterium]|nr:NAD(P)-dependent oxidoreductase [Planctomycetota bacterium]
FKGDKKAADDVYRGMKPLSAQDIAETIYWCANQPAHVNINRIELMPTAQTFAFFAVHRKES